MRNALVVTAVTSLALTGAALTPASGVPTHAEKAPDVDVVVLAKGLVSPLSLAVADDGTRYFSENFKGKLRKQTPTGTVTTLFKAKKGAEVGAVSEAGGIVTFAVSRGNNKRGVIKQIDPLGNVSTLANITEHENKRNPDRRNVYGFRHLSGSCENQLPEFVLPVTYRGVPETHPYATFFSDGTTYVADAGANAIFSVSALGKVRTVAVVPPAKVKVTRKGAEANGVPSCTVGKKYAFEPVPTDVEMGPDGWLYVTSLPGGPEDGSLGANGRVLKVNPATGRVKLVADGLTSPTGLAVAANGDLLVSELFRGRIAKIRAGSDRVRTFVEVKLPGDVEIDATGQVFATINVLTGLEPGKKPRGKLVQLVS